mgnify:CR=1 FL=1
MVFAGAARGNGPGGEHPAGDLLLAGLARTSSPGTTSPTSPGSSPPSRSSPSARCCCWSAASWTCRWASSSASPPFLMHYLIDFYSVASRAGGPALPADGRGRRVLQRLHHRHPRRARVHHHPRHRVSCSSAFCWSPRTPYPATIPDSAAGVGKWLGSYDLGGDHLDHRAGGDLPGGAQPDPLGPAHGRGRRQHPRRQRG